MKYFFTFALFFCLVTPISFAQEAKMSDLLWRQYKTQKSAPPQPLPPPPPQVPVPPPPKVISRLLIILEPALVSAQITINGKTYKTDENGRFKYIDMKLDEINVVITHPDYEEVKETILLTRGKATVKNIKMVPINKEESEKVD